MKSTLHDSARRSVSPVSQSGEPFFVSWSGGKDSCLALWRALHGEGRLGCLFTMLIEGGGRSHSHGLTESVLRAQAESLNAPILFRAASWNDYEATFLDGLRELKQLGFLKGIFGDIDIDSHRAWVETVCEKENVQAVEPLWKGARRALVNEFIDGRFEAILIAVKGELLGPEYLGRVLDLELVGEMEARGIDASGEQGEYHTLVIDGPAFSRRLAIRQKERHLRDGYWFLDVALEGDVVGPET